MSLKLSQLIVFTEQADDGKRLTKLSFSEPTDLGALLKKKKGFNGRLFQTHVNLMSTKLENYIILMQIPW